MNIILLVRDHWPLALCPLGFLVGWYFDKQHDEKLAIFRNKSKLYQRLIILIDFLQAFYSSR
uniref:NADH dehydrogenase [ubiquinone] 1 beta subcomplex subunit 1 n=1 Tax=Laticauda laticaudata TaxID=8630 RepID=A0A8C5S9Z1_LATLA